ncbi:hypothetical protein Curi_c24010 [Gottschalkia acidurici 9a]|uniref:Uncharacterized protein n=1 Tax=Gottschalkia acidurici (strain ATCC 7906 / DSM 604 / BCRC 14475 / CIP 104303 / KCTC 5404 / NCIMB 10678 / 9a) TaxID=1128398 RepID=K0B4F3_GOTA9|nr:hypothetical protein [Gottschalkia acidurici]AFS79396.1 hypothetical protein Curi_c24010 [Gottschalkia acidurici 9a]
MPEIFTRLKNPVDSSRFEKYAKDDLTIYINKELDMEDEVRIKFPKYASDLPEKEFEVLGVKLPTLA